MIPGLMIQAFGSMFLMDFYRLVWVFVCGVFFGFMFFFLWFYGRFECTIFIVIFKQSRKCQGGACNTNNGEVVSATC